MPLAGQTPEMSTLLVRRYRAWTTKGGIWRSKGRIPCHFFGRSLRDPNAGRVARNPKAWTGGPESLRDELIPGLIARDEEKYKDPLIPYSTDLLICSMAGRGRAPGGDKGEEEALRLERETAYRSICVRNVEDAAPAYELKGFLQECGAGAIVRVTILCNKDTGQSRLVLPSILSVINEHPGQNGTYVNWKVISFSLSPPDGVS